MTLERTRLRLLDEKLYLQRRDLVTRLNRRIAGDIGQARSLMKARRNRRDRNLDHRRTVAATDPSGRKKKLRRPKRVLGTRMRVR